MFSNIHLYPDDWKKLPIPDVDAQAQAPIVKLVDKILDAKRTDPNADIAALEQEINARVRRLYGLTPEEIKIVDPASAVAPKAMADRSREATQGKGGRDECAPVRQSIGTPLRSRTPRPFRA